MIAKKISDKLDVKLHSFSTAHFRINQLINDKENFMNFSRALAKKAQHRETLTKQPKEKLSGLKATLTIKNYLGGYYYLTCDEISKIDKIVTLTEAKHSKNNLLPSLGDIKDGLVKMILFSNLEDVIIENKKYKVVPILKLTSSLRFSKKYLTNSQVTTLKLLKEESKINNFTIYINNNNLNDVKL